MIQLATDLFVAHVEALVDADALGVGEMRLESLPAVAADTGRVRDEKQLGNYLRKMSSNFRFRRTE